LEEVSDEEAGNHPLADIVQRVFADERLDARIIERPVLFPA
jgi:hypothetical protein